MRFFRKKLALLLCLTMLLALVGCNKHESITEVITDVSDGESDSKNASGNAIDPGLYIPDISKEALKKEEDVDRAIMYNEPTFKDCGVIIGSIPFTLPFSYRRISDDWTFDLKDYGYDDTFKLGPNDRTSETIVLHKENTGYDMVVGFYNPYDIPCRIDEAYIYSVTIDIRGDVGERPLMQLPFGITWGNSFKEIIEYVHPTEGFKVDHEMGEMYLNFIYDHTDFIMLTVSETKGIVAVTIKSYKEERLNGETE